MARTFYGLTGKQLIGFYALIAVVMYAIIFYVPITSETIVVQCFAPPCPPIVESKTLFDILTAEQEPVACIEIFDPVCGVDGNTYGNACKANVVGVQIAHNGECTEDQGMVLTEDVSTFCRIYPTASGC